MFIYICIVMYVLCILFHCVVLCTTCARHITHTVPSMHFHTKLNGFQQLACLLVTISEILSNTVLL